MPEEQQGQNEGGAGTQGGTQPGGGHDSAPSRTGELDWRARALKAEARAEQLETLAAELAQKLEAAQARAAAMERRQQVEKTLSEHGAIDLETTSLLLDSALGEGGADIAGAVADLRRRKPFLFGAPARHSAMSGMSEPAAPDALASAAEEARASGDRNALLRYLRMKRGQ